MDLFLFIIGVLVFLSSFVYLIVSLIKRSLKKRIFGGLLVGGLFLCIVGLSMPSEETDIAEDTTDEAVVEAESDTAANTKNNTSTASAEPAKEDPEIDTSVFEYAQSTDVTDAIQINNHVTVFVEMSEELAPGLATQHVFNQTYDFVQQPDVEGAETISINIKQGEIKIAMFTVNKSKFTPDDSVPMIDAVVNASDLEFMIDEVKTFGESTGSW